MQPLDLTTNGTTKKDGKPSVKSIFCRLYHKRFVTRPWKDVTTTDFDLED